MISSYSNQELIDELTINRGFHVVAPTVEGARSIMDFVFAKLNCDEILEEIHEDDIAEFMSDDFIVIPKSSRIAEVSWDLLHVPNNGSNFYKFECINLFAELLEKNGADFVYALLEPHKTL